MESTQTVLLGWKRHGLRLLYWLYSGLPFLPEFLSIHTKAIAILQAWHLVSRNRTVGDYAEFGVYDGTSFKLSIGAANSSFDGQYRGRFLAFDSFEGLPNVPSIDEPENVFDRQEYAADYEQFLRRVARLSETYRIEVVKGWFENTLTAELRERIQLKNIAIANIDCDLYESTKPCLDFITPCIGSGTILLFDDWYIMRGSMKRGEAKAVEEWLKGNPQIKLIPWKYYGVAGMSFIVNISLDSSPFYLADQGF